jgi:tRNA (cmo5U34)-methyltransferase
MPDKDFNAAEHFGEDLSSIYDERIREIIPGYEAMHEVAQYLLQENTQDMATILVAGVGTGHETIAFAQSKPQWNIVGFDPSAEMLAAAREKIESLNIQNNIEFIHGGVEDIREDILFDGAASILVMQFLPDNGAKQHYINQISRRLRKGARIIIIDLEGVRNSSDYTMMLSAWKSHQYATRKDEKQIVRDFEHVDENLQFVSEERIRELLAIAGFSNICKFYKSLLFGGYVATKIGS